MSYNCRADALVCVLENVEKPGNLGAILAQCRRGRVAAVIAADDTTDLFNPNAVRASLGTIFTMPTPPSLTPRRRSRSSANGSSRCGRPASAAVRCTRTSNIAARRRSSWAARPTGSLPDFGADDIQPIHLPMLGRRG